MTVADEGPGIHPDDRAGIFDRFYRGATRGEVEGSGLGLAIAKRAVERAGGTLVLAETSAGRHDVRVAPARRPRQPARNAARARLSTVSLAGAREHSSRVPGLRFRAQALT